ncbi:MAG: hypothetical protein J6J23_00665 [Clostridia bacterium]|nr:hypothetical protein [Clostridia bacterium]
MKFCDTIKTIWENLVAEKSFFIKVVSVNALICLMYLVIPASIKTFLGVVFASAGENSAGIYNYLKENLLAIENVISALIAFILVIGCVMTLVSILFIFEKDNKNYKLQQSFGMSSMSVVRQSLIQNLILCLSWNVISIIFAEFLVFLLSTILEIEITITFMYFVILLVAETLITIIVSLLNYLAFLDNSKTKSVKSE